MGRVGRRRTRRAAALSAFDAEPAGDWKPFLEKNRGKEIIFYCRSGRRSGAVAAILAGQGYKVANAGSSKDWSAAGLPTRKVSAEKP